MQRRLCKSPSPQHSPSAVIPGEAAVSYLRGKELCPSALPCPQGASRAQPCPGAGISHGSARYRWDPPVWNQTPCASPNTAAPQQNRHLAHAALAGLSQFTPLSSTAQDIYYFKLNYYFKLLPPSSRLLTTSPTRSTAGGKPGTGADWGF